MDLRGLPWGKIALFGLAAMLITSPTTFPERWALARQLHPAAQARFLALLKAIEARGYRVVLTSSYRPGGGDYHGFGLALDLNIVHVATGTWYRMADEKAPWESTGIPQLIRSMGFRWGGDFMTPWKDLAGNWHRAYDPVHVDLGTRYPIDRLRTAAAMLAHQAGVSLASFDRRRVALAA